jgi:hypothetical protein
MVDDGYTRKKANFTLHRIAARWRFGMNLKGHGSGGSR